MSESKRHSCGGAVYLDAKQSKEAAEIVMHAMREMEGQMTETPFLASKTACAEIIAELAKSLKTTAPIFWDNEEAVE